MTNYNQMVRYLLMKFNPFAFIFLSTCRRLLCRLRGGQPMLWTTISSNARWSQTLEQPERFPRFCSPWRTRDGLPGVALCWQDHRSQIHQVRCAIGDTFPDAVRKAYNWCRPITIGQTTSTFTAATSHLASGNHRWFSVFASKTSDCYVNKIKCLRDWLMKIQRS